MPLSEEETEAFHQSLGTMFPKADPVEEREDLSVTAEKLVAFYMPKNSPIMGDPTVLILTDPV